MFQIYQKVQLSNPRVEDGKLKLDCAVSLSDIDGLEAEDLLDLVLDLKSEDGEIEGDVAILVGRPDGWLPQAETKREFAGRLRQVSIERAMREVVTGESPRNA